jgi:hypothetical protein
VTARVVHSSRFYRWPRIFPDAWFGAILIAKYHVRQRVAKLLSGTLRGFLRLAMGFQRSLMRFGGMLHGLFGVFVPGLMRFLAVVHRGCAVSVGRLFVEFRGALMGIVGHEDPFCLP